MDASKPKAAHSWGELVNEIGVIVLAVLIALAAEQGVELLHWRQQVNDARQAIRGELLDDAANAFQHRAIFKCNSQALSQLRLDLLKSGQAWKGRPVHYEALSFSWGGSAWRTAETSGALAHMPAEEAGGFARAYQFAPAIVELEARSQDDAADIDLLAYDQSLTDGARGRALAAIGRAERRNVLLAQATRQFLNQSALIGVSLPDGEKQKLQARIGADGGDCYAPPKAD
jgi:hypothetical protein